MKARFVQCEICKKEIPLESCELATYRIVIDGEEHVFCCKACSERYQEKRKEQPASTGEVSGE